MKNKCVYPLVTETAIKDRFWTPYLEKVRTITLPYVLDRIEKDGYIDNELALPGKNNLPIAVPDFLTGCCSKRCGAPAICLLFAMTKYWRTG